MARDRTEAAQQALDLGDRPVQMSLALEPRPVRANLPEGADDELARRRELRDRAMKSWAILRRMQGKSLH